MRDLGKIVLYWIAAIFAAMVLLSLVERLCSGVV